MKGYKILFNKLEGDVNILLLENPDNLKKHLRFHNINTGDLFTLEVGPDIQSILEG